MGFLQKNSGFSLIGRVPPGTCPECAVKHEAGEPHNQQSLAYQYHFYDEHGRFPTWADAMAHCSEAVKAVWIEELKNHGIEVTQND